MAVPAFEIGKRYKIVRPNHDGPESFLLEFEATYDGDMSIHNREAYVFKGFRKTSPRHHNVEEERNGTEVIFAYDISTAPIDLGNKADIDYRISELVSGGGKKRKSGKKTRSHGKKRRTTRKV